MSTETEVLQQMATQKLAGFVQAAIYDLSDGRRFPDLMAAVVELARRAEHAAAKADAARTQTEIDMIGTQSTGAGANHA